MKLWDNYIASRPDAVQKYYGKVPRFEDDMEFLPLQAADFWAWWVRKWYSEGTPEKILKPNFGPFALRGLRKMLRAEIVINEDDIAKNLIRSVRQQLDPKYRIVDLKTGESF